MTHALNKLFGCFWRQALVLNSFFIAFGIVGSSNAAAQNSSQALSPSELQQINNQPLAPTMSHSGVMNTPEMRKPSYNFKDGNGTEVTEYKDANSPTQVQVKTRLTTYEMSPPDSVKPGAQSGEGSLLSVPSISIPIQ